ncbi:MAG TPA: LCP family protein [Candidatus Saccharimonadales bacterium]|nr:LCP family protein [Candidatus Saccharimonadales bacterium]
MQRKGISTDGFVVRRRSQQVPQRPRATLDSRQAPVPSRFLIDPTRPIRPEDRQAPTLRRVGAQGQSAITTGGAAGTSPLTLPAPNPRQEKIDIDLNLDEQPSGGGRPPRGRARKQRVPGSKPPLKKVLKWSAIGLLVIGIGVGAYFGYKVFSTSGKIFTGNPIAAIFSQGKPLKADADGNTNVVLFGTSEDDGDHPGADLADSIMVASINQTRKDGYIVSIPRDFHVTYGMACVSGYQGKVNVVYSCAKEKNGGSEDAGAAAMRTKMGEITGLDIQYSVHLNYSVLRQSVDAVGGITVNIESDDPRGILDRNFDWDCPNGNQTCYNVKYPIGPANLDGKHALYLARARGDDPQGRTYGLSRSNPDRQDNQRKILLALKDKASSAGVFTNPLAVNNLLDALGNNLRTTFDTSEIKTLMQLGKDIPSDAIISFSLENKEKPLATASCFSGNICPNAGAGNYSAIQAALKALGTGDKASLEGAKIDVLNASGTAGLAQEQASKLAAENLTVGLVGNAPTSLGSKPITYYDMTGGKKPATLKKLQKLLGVNVTAGKPAGVTSNADFVVVIGAQPESTDATPIDQ